ncbi:MAG: type IV pili methyl-accepting chemotaxis transducer N-terminal domain-containing protein [Ottowia sp.]|nr:type IV pili methyl-accepting chemotaxis transducer N-terminal domain-containing protein [Ottowia sp.]
MNASAAVVPATLPAAAPPEALATVLPPVQRPLARRIVASAMLVLAAVLAMTGATLWLSWRMEGAAAAINDTGSLRMRAQRIAVELLNQQGGREARVREQLAALDETLAGLERGDARRPLWLPSEPAVQAQFARVMQHWRSQARPAVEEALASGDTAPYLAALPEFTVRADTLVVLIERDNAGKTDTVRLMQLALAALVIAGTLLSIWLLHLWIIRPVLRLQGGLQRMAAHEFGARLPVETRDEFGQLAGGYNQMASELQSLYQNLEGRVAEKTAQLAQQNREITTLYDMAAFLNLPSELEIMCQGFLQRVCSQFEADAASIRTLDAGSRTLNLIASIGLSGALTDHERCMKAGECLCGQAIHQARGVLYLRDISDTHGELLTHCRREGFASVAAFRIVSRDAAIGSFSVHFRSPRTLSLSEQQLLRSLGHLLGVALENRRLAAQERELAVVRERSLVAQGLHDSLAQELNFLNLQLQLLDDAVQRGDSGEVDEILPLLRTGVQESYKDVRELLSNFRSKLEQGDLLAAIDDTIARFRRQSGDCTVALDVEQRHGAPLAPEQQLQVLFILQEALSNIRKHAQAQHVQVHVHNGHDFILTVRDDGCGFDPQALAGRSEGGHIGMNIMHERAERMGATISIDSAPGRGTCVTLTLPDSQRQAV